MTGRVVDDEVSAPAQAATVAVRSEDGELVAVKCVPADDAAAVARLHREAERLHVAQGPGVVALLGVGDGVDDDGRPVVELRTRFAGTGTLASRRPPPGEVAPLVAAVATTLASLHRRGVCHGRLRPDHVVVAPDGRPVLCGFGAGTDPDDEAAAGGGAPGDVAALGALLDGIAASLRADDEAAARHLATVATRIEATTSAADVADWLTAAAEPAPRRGPRSRLLLAAAAVVAGSAVGSALLGPSPGGDARPAPGPAAPAGADVAVPAGGAVAAPTGTGSADVDGDGRDDEVGWADGVLSAGAARWSLGTAGDAVLLGDWDCDGTVTPAVVRSDDRVVFVVPRWAAADEEVAAAPVGVLPAAGTLTTPDAGCGSPRARLGDGTTSPLPPVPPSEDPAE